MENASRSVPLLIFLWYLFSIANNVFTKEALKIFPFPVVLCAASVGIQAVGENIISWKSKKDDKYDHIDRQIVSSWLLFPLSLAMAGGPLAHRVALSKGPVALVLTVSVLERDDKRTQINITEIVNCCTFHLLPYFNCYHY